MAKSLAEDAQSGRPAWVVLKHRAPRETRLYLTLEQPTETLVTTWFALVTASLHSAVWWLVPVTLTQADVVKRKEASTGGSLPPGWPTSKSVWTFSGLTPGSWTSYGEDNEQHSSMASACIPASGFLPQFPVLTSIVMDC